MAFTVSRALSFDVGKRDRIWQTDIVSVTSGGPVRGGPTDLAVIGRVAGLCLRRACQAHNIRYDVSGGYEANLGKCGREV